MTLLAHAYIAIRDLHEDGGPAAPWAWARSVQGSTGWTMIEHPSGALLAALRINAIGARGLFALFGPVDILEAIAAGNQEVMPARELWRRRAETQARKAVRAWRTWIVDDSDHPFEKVRRTLIGEGEILPATPPTVLAPWGTVTKLYRPALDHTLAGHALHQTLEDEPDRNP